MGICLSSEDRQLKKKNETIDKELNDDAKRLKKECKILLLGMTARSPAERANGLIMST